MEWALPPVIKIYEALGAIADGRVKLDSDTAKVYSSSGNKHYDVIYDAEAKAISSNDNGSYWQGYLGYPAIAFLMAKQIISHDPKVGEWLKGFHWKDINTQFKNDFAQTENYIRDEMVKRGADLKKFDQYKEKVVEDLTQLKLSKLKTKAQPPKGY